MYINEKMLEEISVLDKLLWDNIKSISIMDNTEPLKETKPKSLKIMRIILFQHVKIVMNSRLMIKKLITHG